jgi:RNA polymerase sigma factor (TIGR02999 family)
MKELDEDNITRILADFPSEERIAVRALLPDVYGELRRLAAAQFATERADHTLEPTALVNEIYVRLGERSGLEVASRAHFFRLASKIMRQILVDHARARASQKRGGDLAHLTLSSSIAEEASPINLLGLEQALEQLATLNPNAARLIELRFFGGLSEQDAAELLGISRTQASREWRAARAWLADELDESGQA